MQAALASAADSILQEIISSATQHDTVDVSLWSEALGHSGLLAAPQPAAVSIKHACKLLALGEMPPALDHLEFVLQPLQLSSWSFDGLASLDLQALAPQLEAALAVR